MNKGKISTSILILFIIAIITFGSYAIYNTFLSTESNTISTGQVKMVYSESNEINMQNIVPISNKKGEVQTNYFEFTVKTYIKTNTQKAINYNITLEPLSIESSYTSFSSNDIKVYLTKVENNIETPITKPITINKLNNYVISSQEEVFNKNDKEHETTYRLRSWLDFKFDSSKLNNTNYAYKFRININNDAKPDKTDYALTFAKNNLGKGGLEEITHEIDDTLQVDEKFKTEYRYRGGNVNNYVYFNCSDAKNQNDETCEKWRIIGIIPTEDANGNVENRLKIIKSSISNSSMAWNSTLDKNTNSYNNWPTATLNTHLNNYYYNTMSIIAKDMIDSTKYYLGGNHTANEKIDKIWQYERKNEANRQGYYYGTNQIMQNDTNKKVAVMYASDYGYAASKECNETLSGYNNTKCNKTNNWLDLSSVEWLLFTRSDVSSYAFLICDDGHIGVGSSTYYFRPVVSLSSSVTIPAGDGTDKNPYQLS